MWKFIKYLFNITFSALALGILAFVIVLAYYNGSLPDHRQLAGYEPPVMTRLYTSNGMLLKEYAKEKRVFIPISNIPKIVVNSFIAAEDRNFYSHYGVDIFGILRALINNISGKGSLQGGSTITQQVAKNIILGSERTLERKIREAILATRISFSFPKERVLELYLNETYLGAGSYGVAAAALNYFDKSVNELNVQEAALLASMPKAPTAYNPWKNYNRAFERRNWVIKSMVEEGFISADVAESAMKEPIKLKEKDDLTLVEAEYFSEEVRRFLSKRFGEEEIYEGGLTVHTTLAPELQNKAEKALRKGLFSYSRRHGYRGRITNMDISGEWWKNLSLVPPPDGLGDWDLAVILSIDNDEKIIEIGLKNGKKNYITFPALTWALIDSDNIVKAPEEVFNEGDVIIVEKVVDELSPYGLRQMPEINGALIAMDPHTGHILAMVGGFSSENPGFNRATQAKRQPGSAFKPFVYLTALEQGFTPSDLIADEPIEFSSNSNAEDKETWSPKNYTGNFYGPTTLRRGVEKSINVMTVHLAMLSGIGNVIDTAKRFGIYKDPARDMSTVLGAAETDLISLTSAYAMLVNGGKKISPIMIDRVQNKEGKTIFKSDNRKCFGCKVREVKFAEDLVPPYLPDDMEKITDEITAFQIVSILEGVVQRGTGKRARSIGKPVAGKTGTTNNSVDSWFIGFSPDLVVGVYTGFDIPRSLGKKEEGSTVALPIFVNFMKDALSDIPPIPFRIPPGVRLVKIDADTGFLPSSDTKEEDIILEAFRPGTEPTRVARKDEVLPVINPPKIMVEEDPSENNIDTPVTRGIGGIY